MINYKQPKEWEDLFKKVVIFIKRSPLLTVVRNPRITPLSISNSINNRVLHDFHDQFNITYQEACELRYVFQSFNIENLDFSQYIEKLIEEAYLE